MRKKEIFRYIIAIVLLAFAAVTVFMSSSVIFDWFGIREKEGDYVPFIVWTNFIAGFLYLISAYGLFKAQNWAFWIMLGTILFLMIALIVLALYINYGGVFEIKNVGAMMIRIGFTIALTVIVYFSLKRY
jgi:hypothetical protein